MNIEAGQYPDLEYDLHVAMVETLNRRVDQLDYIRYLDRLDLVIIDECHIRNFTKIFDHIRPETTVLGIHGDTSKTRQKAASLFRISKDC